MSKEHKRKLSLKALLQFIVLGAGAYSIYEPIFTRNTYYNAFIEGFGITNTEFATLFSIYSMVTLIAYFPGGVLADKYSPRKLLTFSFISTSLLTFWQSTFPPYSTALIIYGALGVSTTLTFWAALIKATRQFGQTMGGESKALGSLEGVRNITKIIISTTCVWLFGRFASISAGLCTVLRIYAVIIFICGILSWIVFSDKQQEEQAVSKGSIIRLIGQCLKNPAVWVISLMVFGSYAMSANLSGYITHIATSNFSLTAQTAAVTVLISTYAQPVGSFAGGWIGDRIGATKAMIVSCLGLIAPAAVILLLPKSPDMMIPFAITFLVFTMFRGAARGQYYGPLREAGVPMHLSGTAVGLIATIGYSGDTFLPIVSGKLLDSMDAVSAYKNFILILIGFGCFSICMSLVMLRIVKNRQIGSDKEAV